MSWRTLMVSLCKILNFNMRLFQYRNNKFENFAAFIELEREAYPGENNNRVYNALESIFKRYRYIYRLREMAEPLLKEQREKVLSSFQSKNMTSPQASIRQLNSHEMQDMATSMHRSDEIQLYFESFFLHASILCDEISQLLLFFFGDARGVKMSGHRVLAKNLEKFLKAKNLDYNDGVLENALYLETELCDFRDKQIVHDFNPRKMKGLSWSMHSGDISLGTAGYHLPKNSDKYMVSKGWSELLEAIDKHVWNVLDIVARNRSKSKLI